MELNVHLHASEGRPLPDPTRYRHMVESFYLAVTCSDISYPVNILLSQFISPQFTIVTSSVFYDIFVARSLDISSFPVLAPCISMPTMMLRGLAILWITVHSLCIVCFLVVPSLIGR
jgi:hypothetical protein